MSLITNFETTVSVKCDATQFPLANSFAIIELINDKPCISFVYPETSSIWLSKLNLVTALSYIRLTSVFTI